MRIKIFSGYFLKIDIKTNFITVISEKRSTEITIRPLIRSSCVYYQLYQNGVKKEFSLRQLIEIAIPKINLI